MLIKEFSIAGRVVPLAAPIQRPLRHFPRMAARLLGAPVSWFSLLHADQLVVEGSHGLAGAQATEQQSQVSRFVCREVVETGRPVTISDLRSHGQAGLPREALAPAAYAGVPVLSSGGVVIGSLCVLEQRPREWTGEEIALLCDLAALAAELIQHGKRLGEWSARQGGGTANEWRKVHDAAGDARSMSGDRDPDVLPETPSDPYRMIFERNPLPLWIFDRETLAFLAVNDAAVAQYGYSREEFLGMTLRDIRPAEECDLLDEDVAHAQGLRSATRVWRHRRKDGTPILAEVAAHDLEFAGRPARIVQAQDVTARVEAERAWRESEERLANVALNLREVLWVAELNPASLESSKLVYISPAVEEVFETTVQAALANSWSPLENVAPDDVARCVERFMRAVRGEENVVEYRLAHSKGMRWIRTSYTPVRDPDGRVFRIAGISEDVTERKEAEELLRRHERQLKEAQRLAHAGSWEMDLATGTSIWSDECYRIWGYEPGGFVPSLEAFIQSIHPDDAARVEEATSRSIAAGTATELEYRIVRHDGTIRQILARTTADLDENGRMMRLVGSVQDVTEQREAEAARRESEARYRTVFEQSNDPIFVSGFDGSYIDVNQALVDQFGYTREELLSGGVLTLYASPGDREILLHAMAQGGGSIRNHAVRLRTRHGDVRDCLVSARTAPGPDGRCIGYQGIIHDVTEMLTLRREMRLLAAALDGMPAEAVSISDGEGTILYANAAHAVLFGYDPEDHPSLNIAALIPDDTAREQHAQMQEHARREGGWSGQVSWRRLDDGSLVIADVLLGTMEDEGRLLFFTISQDASERLAQERQLRRAERFATVGTLVSGVAHELNNPLHAIRNFADLLLMEERGTEDWEALDIIRREADRAARVVSDLRLFARTMQEEQEAKSAVGINDVVQHILRTRKSSLETDGVDTQVELGSRLPRLWADPSRIEQVVLNLVVNAEQAMAGQTRPKRITLRTGGSFQEAWLTIEDTGCGIPSDQLERIFDPFWTTKSPGEGTGLGLSLVHSILADYDGEYHVESEVGVGTKFTIRFPNVPAPQHRTDAGAPKLDLSPVRALRVLVVDDEPSERRPLVRFLKARGHMVHEATDGASARERIATADPQYDVIVTDLRMPGLGSDELLGHLQAVGEGLDRRVIFLAGDGGVDGASVRFPADYPVLLKPAALSMVARLIEEIGEEADR